MNAFLTALVYTFVGIFVGQALAVAFALRSLRRGGGESA